MPPLSVMIKPASSLCNLRCSYCFYSDVTAHRDVTSYGVMERDTLEKLVRKAFAYSDVQVTFAFQGGEPTIAGKEFFREFLRLIHRYNARNVEVHCAIQTNATLLDEDWAEIFKKGNFLVGVSLDGTKTLHDRWRLTASGEPTYDWVEEKIGLLKAAQVEYNILCVVNHAIARNGQAVYENLKKHGYLQFIPCLDGFDGNKNEYSLQPGDYGKFLCDTFPLYEQDWYRGCPVSVRTFDNWVTMILGYPPENCAMCGHCANNFLMEADGSVYPCDFYVLDEWKLGNIKNDSFFRLGKSVVGKRFRDLSMQVNEACGSCEYYPLCRGGCRREREPLENGRLQKNRLCEDHRIFFCLYGNRLRQMARDVARRNGMTMCEY